MRGTCTSHFCEYWLSWTNTISEQNISETILILKWGPCLLLIAGDVILAFPNSNLPMTLAILRTRQKYLLYLLRSCRLPFLPWNQVFCRPQCGLACKVLLRNRPTLQMTQWPPAQEIEGHCERKDEEWHHHMFGVCSFCLLIKSKEHNMALMAVPGAARKKRFQFHE